MMRRVLGMGWRPLPLAIGTMALLVLVKLSGLAGGLASSMAIIGTTAHRTVVPSAAAAESKPPAPAPTPVPIPAPSSAVPPPPQAAAEAAPSEAERALLQDLRARREALDVREKSLEARDGLLKAAEKGLTSRMDQLGALQTRLEALEATRRERDEANWRGLVKTYETMRPRDAASIFNDLEQAVLMQVLDRMKEAKAAAVLAAMQPERARAATAQLVLWRNRPGAGPQG